MFKHKKWKSYREDRNWLAEVRQVDEALCRFVENPTGPNLDRLKGRISSWLASHPRVKNSALGQPLRSKEDYGIVADLAKWVDGLKVQYAANSEAVEPLRAAAQKILDKYAGYMDPAYKVALQENFASPAPLDKPVYCVKHFSKEADWIESLQGDQKVKDLGESGYKVIGITPTISIGISRESAIAANLDFDKSMTAPYNRRIEFHENMTLHNMVHEMLHWCCHEKFRTEGIPSALGDEEKKHWYVLEGFTEWLTRNALDDMRSGSYGLIMDKVIEAIRAGHPGERDLLSAYFRGIDVVAAGKRMIEYIAGRNREGAIQSAIQQLETVCSNPRWPKARANPQSCPGGTLQQVCLAFEGCDSGEIDRRMAAFPNWPNFIREWLARRKPAS